VKVGETPKGKPIYDYQGIAFHAFRKACGSLLLAHGKTLKQVQGWLRHSQLTTTMNVYIHQVDGGLGSADAWDEILVFGATAGNATPGDSRKPRADTYHASGSLEPFPLPAATSRKAAICLIIDRSQVRVLPGHSTNAVSGCGGARQFGCISSARLRSGYDGG